VAGLVVGSDLAEVTANGCDVVSYNVYHHPNTLGVGSTNEVFEFLGGTEVGVNGIPVPSPVTMIAVGGVVNDGTDPDGVETHTLDISEIVLDSVEGTSAVFAQRTACRSP